MPHGLMLICIEKGRLEIDGHIEDCAVDMVMI